MKRWSAASAGLALFMSLVLISCTSKTQESTNALSNVTAMFQLVNFSENRNALLTYKQETEEIGVEGFDGKTLQPQAVVHAMGNVWAAALFSLEGKQRIAVAYGYGRGDLNAPVRIVLYDADLQNPQVIFAANSSRSQVTYLSDAGGKLFVNLFVSKYFTVGGYLAPSTGMWKFHKAIALRLGTQFAIDGDMMYIGRPYGDSVNSTGDLRVIKGKDNVTTMLPTFRGVSSVAVAQLDDDPEKEILIGDGWHQNYGMLAEPRLSLVDHDAGKGNYTLTVVDVAKPQYAISRIIPLSFNNRPYVVTSGNWQVNLYDVQQRWKKQTLYTAKERINNLDVAYLGQDDVGIWLAMLDTNITVQHIQLS